MLLSLRLALGIAFSAVALSAACSTFSESDTAPPLGDASTDGGDGTDPPEGGVTTDGANGDGGVRPAPLVLTSGWTNMSSVVADDERVFFAELTTGILHLVSIEGTDAGAVTAFQQVPGAPNAPFLAAQTLYWADARNHHLFTHAAGLDADAPIVFDTTAPTPFAVAISSGHLVDLALTDGGQPVAVELRPLQALSMATSTFSGLKSGFDMAVDGENVVVTDPTAGKIIHLETAVSGMLAEVKDAPSNTPDCELVSLSGSDMTWTTKGSGTVRIATLGSPAAPPLTIANETAPVVALASDANAIYYILADGRLRRWTRMTQTAETLADGFEAITTNPQARSLTLTSKYVIWLTGNMKGEVLRLPK